MATADDRTYQFKQYRRTRPHGTAGEITKSIEIVAPGLAQAAQVVVKEYLVDLDFQYNFAILEGDSGFIKLWTTGSDDA